MRLLDPRESLTEQSVSISSFHCFKKHQEELKGWGWKQSKAHGSVGVCNKVKQKDTTSVYNPARHQMAPFCCIPLGLIQKQNVPFSISMRHSGLWFSCLNLTKVTLTLCACRRHEWREPSHVANRYWWSTWNRRLSCYLLSHIQVFPVQMLR